MHSFLLKSKDPGGIRMSPHVTAAHKNNPSAFFTRATPYVLNSYEGRNLRNKVRTSSSVLAASSRSFMYLMLTDGAPTNADSTPSSGREVMSTRKFDGSLDKFLARNSCNPFPPVISPLSSKASITTKIGPTMCRFLSGSKMRD